MTFLEKGLYFVWCSCTYAFIKHQTKESTVKQHIIAAACMAVMAVMAVMVFMPATASAIKFQKGTKMTFVVSVNGREEATRHYTYAGPDLYGHRFETDTQERTMWLHGETGELLRTHFHNGEVYNHELPEGKGFLSGKPWEEWSFSYRRTTPLRDSSRDVSCKAGGVTDGEYTVSCREKSWQWNFEVKKKMTVDAKTGMWFRREVVSGYSGKTWLIEVVKRPVVTTVR